MSAVVGRETSAAVGLELTFIFFLRKFIYFLYDNEEVENNLSSDEM